MSKKRKAAGKLKRAEISVEICDAIYLESERTLIGHLYRLALKLNGDTYEAIHLGRSKYAIFDSYGTKLEAKLKAVGRTNTYRVIGCAKDKCTKTLESSAEHVNITGKGDAGCLRAAQRGAVHALLSHWSLSQDVATVVLPTGTGKTETMLATALVDSAKRTLVIVPSIDLKAQIADKFSTWGILRELGVISKEVSNPRVLVLNKTLKM